MQLGSRSQVNAKQGPGVLQRSKGVHARPARPFLPRRACSSKRLLNPPVAPVSSSTTTTRVDTDIDSRYSLKQSDINFYRENGFVKLRSVFDEPTLEHYAPAMSLEVKQADKTPMQKDPDYQQAFTQVVLKRVHQDHLLN